MKRGPGGIANEAGDLLQVREAAHPTYGIIESFERVPFYNDEPKLYQYAVRFRQQWPYDPHRDSGHVALGTATQDELALLKGLCEGIERHCLSTYDPSTFLTGRHGDLRLPAVDARRLSAFNPAQLAAREFRNFRFHDSSTFRWIWSHDALSDGPAFIPAQVIYVPYRFDNLEPILRVPISTGAACSMDVVSAQCRSALEVFERDAFMLWFLCNMPAIIVDISSSTNSLLAWLSQTYRRYRLELIIINLLYDLPFTCILAAVIDRTSLGPAVTVGLKCHPNPIECIVGAVAEAQQMRPWLRDELTMDRRARRKAARLRPRGIRTGRDRALYWTVVDRIPQLTALWSGCPVMRFEDLFPVGAAADWNHLLVEIKTALRASGLKLYFVDVTTPVVRDLGLVVVKAVIPEAHPVYLDERYPYLGGYRLQKAVQQYGSRWDRDLGLNANTPVMPHPFV